MKLGINGRFLRARVTGVQRFAREVAARLLDATDAVVFVPRGAPVPDVWRDKAAVVDGRLTGHAWEQLELPGRAARCDVLLHLAGTAPLRGKRDVLVVHDMLPLRRPEFFAPRFAAWHRFLVPRAARRAAMLVTVSETARADIVRILGIPPDRVRVAPQGLAPFDEPAPEAALRRARAIFGLPDRFVLALGAGDPRKNVDFLVEAMRRWRAADEGAPALVVAGAAERRVHGGRRSESVSDALFLGRVTDEELRALYTLAAAFAFPSFAEGFGRPPLEAIACGTPAVVSDYGAAREVLNGDARIVAGLDVDVWVDALRDVVAARDPSIDRERAQRVGARWRWEDAAAVVLDACQAAMSSKRGSVAA